MVGLQDDIASGPGGSMDWRPISEGEQNEARLDYNNT